MGLAVFYAALHGYISVACNLAVIFQFAGGGVFTAPRWASFIYYCWALIHCASIGNVLYVAFSEFFHSRGVNKYRQYC
jgi:hypothetical protein